MEILIQSTKYCQIRCVRVKNKWKAMPNLPDLKKMYLATISDFSFFRKCGQPDNQSYQPNLLVSNSKHRKTFHIYVLKIEENL